MRFSISYPTRAAATLLALATPLAALAQSSPVTHRVLAQDRNHVVLLNAQGQPEWSAPCSGTAHDLWVLPSGNILTQTSYSNVVEMDTTGKIVWRYDAKPKSGYTGGIEIHAFQPLPNGLTMISEGGNARIIEVDRAGNIVHEIPYSVKSKSPHSDGRLARKLANGNYLVAHEADSCVREYSPDGKVVWEYDLDLAGRPATDGHEGHGTAVFSAPAPPERQHTDRRRQQQPRLRGRPGRKNRLEHRPRRASRHQALLGHRRRGPAKRPHRLRQLPRPRGKPADDRSDARQEGRLDPQRLEEPRRQHRLSHDRRRTRHPPLTAAGVMPRA